MVLAKRFYSKVLTLCLYLVLGIVAFFAIFPFLWMISVSLAPYGSIPQSFATLIPSSVSFSSYVEAWRDANFARYFLNTVIFTVGSTAFTLFFCALGGYTFARFSFPGRKVLFLLILFTMMIPAPAVLIPRFLTMKFFPFAGGNNLLGQGGIGFVNSYAGLILPFTVTGFGIFLFRQFFLTLPQELVDSARIDGCPEFRIFLQIMLPLTKPAAVALTIFTFVWRWNKLLWPLIIAQGEKHRVIAVALAVFRGEQRTIEQWNVMMAAATIAVVPVVLVFLVLQKHFTKGVSLTGIKA